MAKILTLYRFVLFLLNYFPQVRLDKETLKSKLPTVFIAANLIHLMSILLFLLEKLVRYRALNNISRSEHVLGQLLVYVDCGSATIIRAVAVMKARNDASLFRLFEGRPHVKNKRPSESNKVPKASVIVVLFLMAVTANHSCAVISRLMQGAWNSEGYNGTRVQSSPVIWVPVHILGSLADHTAVPMALSFIMVFGFMLVKSYNDQVAEWVQLLPGAANWRRDCVPSYYSIRGLCLGFKMLKNAFKMFRSVSEVYSFCLITNCTLACLRIMGHLTKYESLGHVEPTLYEFGFINSFCVSFLAYAGNEMKAEVRQVYVPAQSL